MPSLLPSSLAKSASVWRPAVKRAGLEGVTFHDLRHYYASMLIRHNESVKVVQARLGHATAAETLDTYSHLWPDSEDRTREAVDVVLGACAPVCPGRGQPTHKRRSDGLRGTSRPVSRVLVSTPC